MDSKGEVSVEDKTIRLEGGEIYLTRNGTSSFQVQKGTVLVYILPLASDGEAGRRYLLYEAEAGQRLPAFCVAAAETTWVFGLVALDQAEMTEVPDSVDEQLQADFVAMARIRNFGEESYEDQILEEYHRNLVKEENYIFATDTGRREVKGRILRLIYKLFEPGVFRQKTQESGNHLYDAMSYICDRRNIDIVSYDKVVASSGRRFKLEDVARVSHFIIREVTLDSNWYHKDSGPMVAFLEEGRKAVALMPRGTGGYSAYEPETHQQVKVDESYSDRLEVKAYILYRPFPNKKLSLPEMFGFGMKESDTGDWIRFCILMLLGTLVGILLPMLNEQIYDKYIPMSFSAGVVQICAVLLACNIGNLSFTIVKNLSSLRGVTKMENAVMAACCERLFNLPESFFRDYKSSDLSDRVMKINRMFRIIAKEGIKTFVSALFSILYLFQMFKYSKDLTVVGILMVAGVMAVIIVIAVRQTKYETELMETSAEASGKMYQFLAGIQKIRMAGVEDRAFYEYLEPYFESKKITMHKERMTNVVNVITSCAISLFTVVFYYQLIEKQLPISVGQYSAFASSFGAFAGAMMAVGTALLKLNEIKPLLDRLKPILGSLPEYSEDEELPGDLQGDIEISNVDFSYVKDGDLILKDLSLHIKPGEYIGLVGSSGCGKSTLIKLLLGFEKPDSGKIFYDSKDIDGMDKRELRKKMGVVLQDGRLIAGSIYENITISAPGATIKDAERIAAEVGLAEDIAQMPMGMHTMLSAGGGTISGGQMQRILIARAIVGKPRILFFDEATSALDNVTQAMVCESLAKLKVTRLVIAHRLSTIQDCDRIIVMDKGQIAEQGDFETLMKKRGLFYELASRQMA